MTVMDVAIASSMFQTLALWNLGVNQVLEILLADFIERFYEKGIQIAPWVSSIKISFLV